VSDQPSSTQAYAPPLPPTPPPFPPAAPPATSPTPPKKRHGCLIAAIIALVLVLGVVGAGFAVVSSMGKPRDLGVRYTIADYHSAAKKVGLAEFASAGEPGTSASGTATGGTKSSGGSKSTTKGGTKSSTKPSTGSKPSGGSTTAGGSGSTGGSTSAGSADTVSDTGFTTDVTYTGSKPFDVVLTSAEMSALLNYSHMPGWPISDAQVVFTGADGFAMSMYFEFGGVKYPVYASGTAAMSGGTVSGTATEAQVLGWTVPGEYLGPGGDYVLEVINSRLGRLGTLDVTSAEVVDGGLHLVGTGPAKAEGVTP